MNCSSRVNQFNKLESSPEKVVKSVSLRLISSLELLASPIVTSRKKHENLMCKTPKETLKKKTVAKVKKKTKARVKTKKKSDAVCARVQQTVKHKFWNPAVSNNREDCASFCR
jgi:hypothetical protein